MKLKLLITTKGQSHGYCTNYSKGNRTNEGCSALCTKEMGVCESTDAPRRVSFIEALTRKEERVSEAFAQALSHEFGTTHKFWLNLQQFTDDFVCQI